MRKFFTVWLFALILTGFVVASFQSGIEQNRLETEARTKAATLASSIEDSVLANYHANRLGRIAKLADRLRLQSGFYGFALCRRGISGLSFPKTARLEALCQDPGLKAKNNSGSDLSWKQKLNAKNYQFSYHPFELSSDLQRSLPELTSIILVQDLTYLRQRWVELFLKSLAMTLIGGFAVFLIAATQMNQWLRLYIAKVRNRFRAPSLQVNAAPQRAAPTIRQTMGERNLVVIANREPYIHQFVDRNKDEQIEVMRPASGLVTALEPILRQTGGIWVAHGSGSADQVVVDSNDEVRVPPNRPKYSLKRVWLSKEEEQGYYYGFSNEGLWPLCHLAHTRPTFRLSDWEQYKSVNQKFCDAIPASVFQDDSLILVQDYHFALLPKLIKERALAKGWKVPTVGIFWHIPWPNPEAFGICPWNRELLQGMLGADVIGFHTQYHCNNFLESCNRYLEARIDQENFSVTRENHESLVKPFPIGIDTSPVRVLSDQEKEDLKTKYGIKAKIVAVGVDRIDYTKGIVERIEAVERFLEKNPAYVGKFSLVQMGSPSRTHIPAYRDLATQLESVVKRINDKYANADGYQPIVFIPTHHDWDDIQYFYQLGDVCMVTSLHDGMNLVAKEYVWCQRPDRGSLILSKFTGASRELTEAFIINPYSIEEMADAILGAVSLSATEKASRMIAMKQKVQTHNAYEWASALVRSMINQGDKVAPQTSKRDLPGKWKSARLASGRI